MATMPKEYRKPSVPLTLVLLTVVWLTASG